MNSVRPQLVVSKKDPRGRVSATYSRPHLVSARHEKRIRNRDGDAYVPLDLWHAHRPGHMETLCGRPAVEWRIFWSLSFEDAGGSACPAYTSVVEVFSPRH